MILTIIVCVCVPVVVVVCGSRRYVAGWVVGVVCGALAVAFAVRDVALLVGVPFYPWSGPVIASFALIVLGTLTGWVSLKVDHPIGIGAIVGTSASSVTAAVGGLFVASSRRRSLAADVRRRVKQYRIEVA